MMIKKFSVWFSVCGSNEDGSDNDLEVCSAW